MMAFLRQRLTTIFPHRWGALILAAVLLCWTTAGWTLTPAPGTSIVNRVAVQYDDAHGNPLPAASGTATVVLSAQPLLRLEKTADSDPVLAGATFNYTLRYENTGNAAATGVQVVDTLPANLVFQSASAGGVHNPVNRTVTWSIGNLASGSGGVLTVTVNVPADQPAGTKLVNTALATSAEGAQVTVALAITVGAGPNLLLTKEGSPAQVAPNGTIAYTLSYRNIGNADAHSVRITDQIPSGTAYVEGSATPAASLTGNILTWNLGDFAAGGQGTAGFQVRVSPLAAPGQKISNVAVIESKEQIRTSNTLVTTVSAQPQLLLKMSVSDTVRAGLDLTYILQVENTGDTPLTGVVLSDPLPVGTTFVSADGSGIAAPGGRQVDWAIGNLELGQKQTVKLIVRVDPLLTQGQTIENIATVVSNETSSPPVRVLSGVNARTPGTVEFYDSAWQPAYGYNEGDKVYLQVKDLDQNIDPTSVETVTVVLKDLKTGDTETVLLTETGPNTGIFRNVGNGIPTSLAATVTGDGKLTVAHNSRIQATYADLLDESPVSNASALIDPLGIVFDSVSGNTLPGVVVTLRNWNGVTNACDLTSWPVLPPGQINPAAPTGTDGRFAFPLVPPGDFCFEVKAPKGYTFPSAVSDTDLPVGFTIGNGSRGDKFTLSVGDPALIRDIPLDPPAGSLTVVKTGNKTTAAIGDLVGYSLKVTNTGASPVRTITLTDVMPHGVQYIPGSTRVDGQVLTDPRVTGSRTFAWDIASLAPGATLEITYRAVVGPDSMRGNGVNTAVASGVSLGKTVTSNTASCKVKITAGIFTEKGTILGKIFLDRDGDRIQNQGTAARAGKPDEPGIPNVVLYLEDGTRVITDKSGKFSILGIMPGTHVLRVDETTLPRGLVLIPLSNRFLGDDASQFVSMNPGGLFLVGMGEVTIGHGRGKGPDSFLKDNAWFDNGLSTGGRGAFFMKGKIYEDVLLSAAYDSDKKKRDDLFRENDTNLDTEDKYPIYGDESKTGYEAVSADKLYLKLEKNRSYLLYGDYKTDLNDTRLAAYNRSFNGLKYELNTEKFKIRSFGSYTDQSQIIDALPGKGVSGYYYLTKRPVVEGSERVVIEVRDRYRPDNVLSRESKGRGSDYEIDYDLGAVLFKEPIPSHDGDYNPVYIVVGYESKTDGEKYYIYGGRGAFKVFNGLEVGATGIVEEKAVGSYRLMGTDFTLTLPRKTIVKAEYAETDALFEETSVFNWRSGKAWLVNLESEPLEKLRLAGYYRTLGNDFMNLSAVDASRGTTKYGFDMAYELKPDTRIQGRFFDERDDLNAMKHRLGSIGLQTKFKKTKITGEISNESSSDSYIPLVNPNNRSPFDISQETPHELTAAKVGMETELRPDLSLTLSHKQNLSQDSYHMSQAGLNYQINNQNRLYLREEYQKYQDQYETRTLFGVETQLLKNTVAYNEYRLADGADGSRNQDVLGLRNKFYLGKNVTGNVAAEYLKTISGSQRQNEPDAVAGSLGFEYLAREEVKVTSRFEHRRELIDRGRDSYLGEVGLAYKLHPDYSLLLRERYFTEDAGTGGSNTSSRTMVGVAYRPLLSNRFNALTKLEYKHEANAAAIPSFREEAWIFSGEGVWQATPRLQLTAKYAGKLARDAEFSSYTDLISGRFVYDLTDRWDVGAEYRILTSHAVNSRYQGGAAEVGYRVIKNLWVAAGYSFDKFDADLAGDGYQGEGPYLKLRVKFDEKVFKGFRSTQPSAETLTKTSTQSLEKP